jgi:hypothetical protein
MDPARLAHPAIIMAIGLYVSNLLLGIGVQLRLVSTKRARWVHHALYFVVFISAIAATVLYYLAQLLWWPLLITLVMLAVLPRFKGGTRIHMYLTITGGLGYILAVLLS